MECSNMKCPVLFVLAIFCIVSYSNCMESMCTKFMYEEQLLEKMVRLEFYVENTVNTLDKSISNSVEELTADIGNIKTNITGVIEDFQLKNEEWKEIVERQTSAASDETKADINETEKVLRAEIQTLQATVTKSLTDTKQLEENVERQQSATKAEIDETGKILKTEIQTIQAIVTKSLTDTKQLKENIENKISTAIEDAKNERNMLKSEIDQSKEDVDYKVSTALEDAKKEIQSLKVEIGQLKGKTPMIAFNVYHVTALSPGSSKPVIFETVLLNEGGGYDKKTGYFTATVSGVYQFNAQLCTRKGKDLNYDIVVDGKHIARGEYRTSSDSDDGACTSIGAIGIVRRGEKAEVRGWSTEASGWLFDQYLAGDDWNSFSGVLVKTI